MAESIAQILIIKEDLVSQTEFSTEAAHCHIPYCPSSIRVCCVKVEGEDCYYISHIPHFHNNSTSFTNPIHLQPVLQAFHYIQSGLTYFNDCLSLLHSNNSSSITILQKMIEKNKTLFIEECNSNIRLSAIRDIGEEEYENILKIIKGMNGKYITRYVINRKHNRSIILMGNGDLYETIQIILPSSIDPNPYLSSTSDIIFNCITIL